MTSSPLLLFRYLAKEFLKWLGIVFGGFFALIFVFDLIELIRRTSSRLHIKFSIVMQMVWCKVPQIMLEILPFVVLIATVILFWRLNRQKEILAMRMSGISIWQILTPLIVVVMLLKIVDLGLMNPFAAALYQQYEKLENKQIKGRGELLSIAESGLWIRQNDHNGPFILRAGQLEKNTLKDVTIFVFGDAEEFLYRFDAGMAHFEPKKLVLEKVVFSNPAGKTQAYENYIFHSDLTLEHIHENSAHPKTLSFWKLPDFIQLLERSGLSGHRYRLYWHALIAKVFLVIAMVILGAGCVFFHQGRSKSLPLIAFSLGLGFAIFFLEDITYALGLAMTIPIFLAAWVPALTGILLGITIIFYLEDG